MSVIVLILNFIRKNWFIISIMLAIFSLYIYINVLRSTIVDLESDILIKNAEITACKQNINDRNKMIEEWSKKTIKENKEMLSLKKDISNLTRSANIQIRRIMKQNSPETCDDTIKYFIEMGQQYE